MIKNINKKIAFGTSLFISSMLGFIFTENKGSLVPPSEAALDAPIFSSVERALADGGGDCSCGCDVVFYPDPAPSQVTSGVGLQLVP